MTIFLQFLILLMVTQNSSFGLTLADCYTLSLKQSETIAIQQELIEEAEGRFLRALSVVLPHASFSSSDKRQDGSGGSAFTLKEVPERKFVLNQNLFSGFKEIAAMASVRAEKRQRTHEKTRAEQLLLVDVANAFYLLLEQHEDLETLETTRTTLLERMEELKQRETLGRSRPSEVVSAEAQLRRVEAEIERVQSQEVVARQLLEFLTGRDRIEKIADSETSLPSLKAEENYLAKAGKRPDVQAAEEAWRAAQKKVSATRGALFPTVALEGNYYVERAGAAEDVNWDVALKVDAPIFQGGDHAGAMKEATAREHQAKLQFQKTERAAALDIRGAYATLRAAIARSGSLQKAREAAEKDYQYQVEDYRLSLVSNLDVLKALESLQEARRDYLHAMYEAKRLYWQLRITTGETL